MASGVETASCKQVSVTASIACIRTISGKRLPGYEKAEHCKRHPADHTNQRHDAVRHVLQLVTPVKHTLLIHLAALELQTAAAQHLVGGGRYKLLPSGRQMPNNSVSSGLLMVTVLA